MERRNQDSGGEEKLLVRGIQQQVVSVGTSAMLSDQLFIVVLLTAIFYLTKVSFVDVSNNVHLFFLLFFIFRR